MTNRQKMRRLAWLAAALMTGAMYALVVLALDMQFAVNDDTIILRSFMGYEGSIPSFHLLLHGLMTWPLKWLGETFPGVAWYSILQIALLAFGCVVIAKSIIQCFVNQGRSFWMGVAFAAVFLGAFCLEVCARVTFTCTAAVLGAAAVLQLLSIDHENASSRQVFGGILLALILAALGYALRQITIWPVLGFCGLALLYGAVRFYRPFQKEGKSLRPLLAGAAAVVIVLGGLMVWRSAEEKGHEEYMRWSNVPLIDYYNLNTLTPEMLEQAGWDDVTVQMATHFCYLNPAMTTESMELLVELADTLPQSSPLEKGLTVVENALFGDATFRLTVEAAGWLLLGCIVALALKKERRGWHWATLGLNAALFAACLLYLGIKGRLPLRAVRMVLTPMAAALLGMLPAFLPQKLRGKSIGLICLALCMGWTGWYLAETIPGLLPNEELELSIGNPAESLDAYALSEPEVLFIYDDTLISDARMFPDVSEGIPTNVVFWGGWGFRSESSYQQFAAFDIELDNLDAEMWLREDVCYASAVLDPPAKLLLEYLRRELDPEVDYGLYGEDGGVYYYQFE